MPTGRYVRLGESDVCGSVPFCSCGPGVIDTTVIALKLHRHVIRDSSCELAALFCVPARDSSTFGFLGAVPRCHESNEEPAKALNGGWSSRLNRRSWSRIGLVPSQ